MFAQMLSCGDTPPGYRSCVNYMGVNGIAWLSFLKELRLSGVDVNKFLETDDLAQFVADNCPMPGLVATWSIKFHKFSIARIKEMFASVDVIYASVDHGPAESSNCEPPLPTPCAK